MKTLWYELLEVALRHRVSLRVLASADAARVGMELERRYARPGSQPLWERVRDPTARQSSEAWRAAANRVPVPVVLLIQDSQDRYCGAIVEGEGDLLRWLEESPPFVFYLTNMTQDYLITLNDHEFIGGAGEASHWVSEMRFLEEEAGRSA
jgi:hypothetical protein